MTEADRLIREQFAKALEPARADGAFRERLARSIEENRPILDRLAEDDHGTGPSNLVDNPDFEQSRQGWADNGPAYINPPLPHRPTIYGPDAAARAETAGLLNIGDARRDEDGGLSMWSRRNSHEEPRWRKVEFGPLPPRHVHDASCAFGNPQCDEFARPAPLEMERTGWSDRGKVAFYVLLTLVALALVAGAAYVAIDPEGAPWTP